MNKNYKKFKEAMGLASMNPMVGMNNQRAMISNNIKDKDLTDGWGSYGLITDINSKEKLTLNGDGKLIKSKFESINEDLYYLNIDIDDKYQKLLEELNLPIEERPVHDKTFLYEFLTEHKLYTQDQLEYDNLLEKVYLDKLSKQMSAAANNTGGDTRKDSHYPLEEKPTIGNFDQEDEGVHFPLLSHAELLDQLEESIMKIRGDDYIYELL